MASTTQQPPPTQEPASLRSKKDAKFPKPKISVHDPLHLIKRVRHSIRNFPLELLPLAVVVTAGLSGATFAMIHKWYTDPNLRKFPM
ncbi:10444_t:CDS:1, partial [Ambispora gerdemannii]